jgi:hypothetical protein
LRNEIPQVLSNGCPYGAVQAIWAQDAQLISIDIIENAVTLADIKSRDFWSRARNETRKKNSVMVDGCGLTPPKALL